MGINISPDVLITRNIIMGLLAALSSPSMLADMFIKIDPITGCPFGISGNKRQKTGLSQRANALISPLFSPIFMTPSQSESTPVSPSETSKAVFEETKVEFMISVNISVFPVKISFPKATMKAMIKKAIQM